MNTPPHATHHATHHALCVLLTLTSTLLISCEPHEPASSLPQSAQSSTLATQRQSVVYGEESRRDYYELSPTTEGVWRSRARASTGLLVRPNAVRVSGGVVSLSNYTLGQAQNLCEGEAFAEQPQPGFCSGTLIADDLFLTAGHCVDDSADCDNTSVVFNYLYTAEGQLNTLTSADLYQCQSIVTRRNSSGYDYAIIRLDRSAASHLSPAPLNLSERPLELGEELTLIGGPNGLPVKTDTEGRLTNPQTNNITFNASLDAFGGNSGSAIYDALGEVVGILVQGRSDYYTDPSLGCRRVSRVPVDDQGQPTDGGNAETGVYVGRALDALCTASPTHDLCVRRDELLNGGTEAGTGAGTEAGAEAGTDTGTGGATGGTGGEPSCEDSAEPDDVSAQATPLTLGRVSARNFCDDALDWARLTLEQGAVDIETYRVGVMGAGDPLAAFSALSDPLDISAPNTQITLYDSRLLVLSSDDDGGDGALSALLGRDVLGGEYLARVSEVSPNYDPTLSYAIMAREACTEDSAERLPAPHAQHHDDYPSALLPALALPSITPGALCDEDWRRVSITQDLVELGATLRFETRVEAPTDTVIALYNERGELLAENDDAAGLGLGSALEWTPTETGDLWLRVRGYNHVYGGDRPYTLTLSTQEVCDDLDNDQDGVIDESLTDCLTCVPDDYEDNDTLAEAVPIGLGYDLSLNHCLDDQDWFSFTLLAGQRVDLETRVERSADTIITLYNRQGEQIAQNDDIAQGNLASAIRGFEAPYTGGYWLKVSEFNNLTGPAFSYSLLARLSCADDSAEPNDTPLEAQTWSPTSGALSLEGALCDADWLRFDAEAGRRFTFEVSNPLGVGPTLEVSRDFGRQPLAIARDLGSEGLTRLSFEAPTSGTYWLALTSFDLAYGGDSAYSLTLTPHPAEQCNEGDDDLDGEIDEGVSNACGACGPLPIELCNDEDDDCDGVVDEGALNACGFCGLPPDETCDDIDNDCDGLVDEGVRNSCGACGEPPAELCDEVDNDCDGSIDEGTLNLCGTCGPAPTERCDGLDNDCDGALDEGLELNACGVCGEAPVERCDEVDNDCDGTVDEGLRNACGVCGEEPIEACNGEDDDCDGEVDEGTLNACGACGPTPTERCEQGTIGVDEDCDGVVDEGCEPMSAGVEAGVEVNAGAEAGIEVSAGAEAGIEVSAGAEVTLLTPIDDEEPEAPSRGGHIGGGCDQDSSVPSPLASLLLALFFLARRALITRRHAL